MIWQNVIVNVFVSLIAVTAMQRIVREITDYLQSGTILYLRSSILNATKFWRS